MDDVHITDLMQVPAIVYGIRNEVSAFPPGSPHIWKGGAKASESDEEELFADLTVTQDGIIWLLEELSGEVWLLQSKDQPPILLPLNSHLPSDLAGAAARAVALTVRPSGGVSMLAVVVGAGSTEPRHVVFNFDGTGQAVKGIHLTTLDGQSLSIRGITIDIEGQLWIREYTRTVVCASDGNLVAELPSGVVFSNGTLVSNESPPRLYNAAGYSLGPIDGLPRDFDGPWQLAGPGPVLISWDDTEKRPDSVEQGLEVLAVYRVDITNRQAWLEERLAWPAEIRQEPGPDDLGDALPLLSQFAPRSLSVDETGNVYILQYTPTRTRVHRFSFITDGPQRWRNKFELPNDLTDAERQLYRAEYLVRLGQRNKLTEPWKSFFAPMAWYRTTEPQTIKDEDNRILSELTSQKQK